MDEASPLSSRAKKVLHWGGYALFAAAIAYCGFALHDLGVDALAQSLSSSAWISTVVLGLAYGAALTLLAVGWSTMAGHRYKPSLTEQIAIYGPAVVAKYIPGSIFQYGSRQLNGAEFGLEQKPMVKASLAEAALHVPSALLSAAILLVGGGLIGLVAMALSGFGLAIAVRQPLFRAACLQVAFFALFAIFMIAIAGLALSSADPERLTALFMLAWVAGFLVPVAPGGIGVRESALLALAVPTESAAVVAAFALLTRLATTIGDSGIGLVGYWLLLSRRWNKQASA